MYHDDDSMKQWATSEDEPKHAYYLLYNRNDGTYIGHFHAVNKIKAFLAVEGIHEPKTYYVQGHRKDHDSYGKQQLAGVSPKQRNVNTMTPVFKDLHHYTSKTIPERGSEELIALMKNKQNTEKIQEAIEEQISELLNQVSYASDAVNETTCRRRNRRKVSNKMDRANVNNSTAK